MFKPVLCVALNSGFPPIARPRTRLIGFSRRRGVEFKRYGNNWVYHIVIEDSNQGAELNSDSDPIQFNGWRCYEIAVMHSPKHFYRAVPNFGVGHLFADFLA